MSGTIFIGRYIIYMYIFVYILYIILLYTLQVLQALKENPETVAQFMRQQQSQPSHPNIQRNQPMNQPNHNQLANNIHTFRRKFFLTKKIQNAIYDNYFRKSTKISFGQSSMKICFKQFAQIYSQQKKTCLKMENVFCWNVYFQLQWTRINKR